MNGSFESRALILQVSWIALVSTCLLFPGRLHGEVNWDEEGDRAVGLLQTYLRIDTSNAPGVPGATGDVRAAVEFFERLLREDGLEPRRLVHPEDPTRTVLLGRLKGDGSLGKTLLLEHHMDVVPAEGQWTHPPFGAEIHDGFLYGRGTMDDKGLGILHLQAIRLLRREKVPLGRDVVFVATPDEEIGGEKGAAWLARSHWDLLDPALVLEEGGMGYAGKYNRGLAFEVQVQQKRVFWLELEARGEGGHGSVPRENGLLVLHQAIERVLDMPRPPRLSPPVAATYQALARDPEAARRVMTAIATDPSERARLTDSLTLTQMEGSKKVNSQPRVAKAGLDIRLLPDTDPAEFLGRLKKAIGDERVAIRELHPREEVGPASPTDGPVYRAIEAAMAVHYPGALILPTMSTGGTDSRNYRVRGVPAYGFIPLIVPEGDNSRIHDVDERVRVEEVKKGVKVFFDLVKALAEKRS
ncbi:MAG: M20/M25/M40 family metallo-hydrolase [Planctomycetes bacterium]|nr:M20/M25/M40 family metallo-hydrolase [Planctomycetota bacterium]